MPGLFAARLFQSDRVGTEPAKLTQAEVSGLLDAIPPYFSQDVVTANRRVATLAFGIRLSSLAGRSG